MHKLGTALDAAVDHRLRKRAAELLLQVVLRVESLVRGAYGLHPQLERKRHPVRVINLVPRAVDGLLGVEDEAVEIEYEGSNQLVTPL